MKRQRAPLPGAVHHCGRFMDRPVSRREMLERCAGGFGALAAAALLAERGPAAALAAEPGAAAPSAPSTRFHHPPRARSVIFLYMDGGPSQVDTFDPKPRLDAEHGRPFAMSIEPTQFNQNGRTLRSPWPFRPRGRSGLPVSSLFPEVGECADDLCVIRSMVSSFSEHTSANFFLHTGTGISGRPTMGAWAVYGLGTEDRDLPGFVVLNGGLVPPGGLDNFSSGFLPAAYQGSLLLPRRLALPDIEPAERIPALQKRKLALVRQLDEGLLGRLGPEDQVESAIRNQELAFRMQAAVPALMDLDGETEATRRLYGLDAAYAPARTFGTECLIARRLVERGVRFVEVTCPRVGGDRWDQHGNLREGHENNARAVDRGIAALLRDLKSRGLLRDTLVVWAGEFGRTPFAQGTDGRDHNPFGFSIWLAGGGVKGGMVHGATDEYGYKVVEDRVEVHDLHATLLHLLGIDHRRLTFRFGGRDMRLTDVHGEVVRDLLA